MDTTDETPTGRDTRVRGRILLGAHAALLALPLWVVADEWLTPGVDADIGFGFAVAALAAWGSPWSLAWGGWDAPVGFVVATALLDLALHAVVRWWAARRVP